MFYDELRDGVWERLDIDGEMLMGRAHHVIYFASPERWLAYPRWARDRRDEIIARITSEFREPDYEYHGLAAGPAATPSAPSAPEPMPPPTAASARKSASAHDGRRALLVAVLALFALAAAMAWLVTRSVARDETYIPIRNAVLRRTVSRDGEPVTFWISIGAYTAVGVGALALGALGVREGRRL
jgi:hypothetical protein